jgi:hypothetical protein
MLPDNTGSVPVIDFRRQRLILQWHVLGGTWTAFDVPPPLVHGVASIRPSQPNICVYAQGGRLRLQVGPEQFALTENSPRIRCSRGVVSFGLRRHFNVVSSTDGVLFSHAYWTNQGDDFFRWLAARAQDPEWRVTMARRWSEGVPATTLRAA